LTPAQRLRRPGLTPLVDELARRFCRGDIPVRITLKGLDPESQAAVADLLGSDRLAKSPRVRVEQLLNALGLNSVSELRDEIEAICGPLVNRRLQRETETTARESLWDWLGEEVRTIRIGDQSRGLESWVARQRILGIRGGVDLHRQRLEQTLAVLRALPANGLSLAELAATHAGEPHALDRGRSVGAIVLDAIAEATGVKRAQDGEATRALWESVGVVPDPLSSTVLALGLPGDDRSPLGRWLSAAQAVGEPVVLSLANLRRWPLVPLTSGAAAYVIENPSLVAAACASRWRGPPLLCSSGRPSIAVVTLLRQLSSAGAAIRQHADFDPTGIAITNWLRDKAGTVPWRMTSDDYLGAAHARRLRRPFLTETPLTHWDPRLRTAMNDVRIPVYEEDLRIDLLTEICQ
jgi:uncharacterized protein (TIGR02679 family)